MKKVIFGDELEKKKKDAIDLICNAVASTIGPIGNNVLIKVTILLGGKDMSVITVTTENFETEVECPFVYGSFASIAPAKEVAISEILLPDISWSTLNFANNSSSKFTPS